MAENVFVEEYRKELEKTGYPFTTDQSLPVSTGYTVPPGLFADASIYCESNREIPLWESVEKTNEKLSFHVGTFTGVYRFSHLEETVSLYSETGLFGGILVCREDRIRALRSWTNGRHRLTRFPRWCLRCLQFLPSVGVQRLKDESGEPFSGDVVIACGKGCTAQMKTDGRLKRMVLNFCGDPLYAWTHGFIDHLVPIQKIICLAGGNEIELKPKNQAIACYAVNPESQGLDEDALQIAASGHEVTFSLGGF